MRSGACAIALLCVSPGASLTLSRQPLVSRPHHALAQPRCSEPVATERREEHAAPAREDTVQERLRLFWRLAVPYFENAEGAKLNFGLMLLLVLINSGISVIFSYVGRDFYSALSAKDQALFLEKTSNYAVGLAVATPLTVLYKFQRQRLALNWRARRMPVSHQDTVLQAPSRNLPLGGSG